jgi:hypothetical protein
MGATGWIQCEVRGETVGLFSFEPPVHRPSRIPIDLGQPVIIGRSWVVVVPTLDTAHLLHWILGGRLRTGPRCGTRAIEDAVQRFRLFWNLRDAAALAGQFVPTGELDMSARDQGVMPRVHGGWTQSVGRSRIAAFARSQWRHGEGLTFVDMKVFLPRGGAEVLGLRGTYGLGSAQDMGEGKFVYSCAERGLTHVVVVARKPAT